MKRRSAFTLLEVMVAVAILGLSAAGSLRLLTISARLLEDVRVERRSLSLARTLWLAAAAGKLAEQGRENDYSWESKQYTFERQPDVPEGFYCRKVVLVQADPLSSRSPKDNDSFVFYLPEMKIKKERTE